MGGIVSNNPGSELEEVTHEVSCGGVVFRDGTVLMLRRRTGEWVFPKGHVEPGERLVQTACREVQEEAGVAATALQYLGVTEYRAGPNVRKTVHWFLMRTEAQRLKPEGIFQEGRFVPARAALQALTYANDRLTLLRALRAQSR
ncbi:MAG: NUDIX hydrolase [Deinococcus sp.]|nr:NUDIX hydrolase [Deinococcus sp.]